MPQAPIPHVNDAAQFAGRIVDGSLAVLNAVARQPAGGGRGEMNFRVGTLRNRTEDKQPATGSEPGTRLGLLLIVCCVAQFMVILDLSIVNVALPSIQSDLGFSSGQSAVGRRRVRDRLRRLPDARRARE